jgi:hypothetical protein
MTKIVERHIILFQHGKIALLLHDLSVAKNIQVDQLLFEPYLPQTNPPTGKFKITWEEEDE